MIKGSKVLVITSGAYANAEITSDFGLLPSAFLPIGHKRLFEIQIDNCKNFNAEKFIILPDDYKLLERDKEFFVNNNVNIHRNNPNLNLAQSIISFINTFEKNDNFIDELYILHGDTLFYKLEQQPDLLYYGFTDMFYKWGHLDDVIHNTIENNTRKQAVLAGYFTFSNPNLFRDLLVKSNSFESALKNYNNVVNFKIQLKARWLDFGHSNLYYKSKMELNVARNFNEVIANNNFIKKASKNTNKITSEYNWYKQLPKKLKIFTPVVWGFKNNKRASYKIEFIGAPTLQEKWVFGNLPDFVYYNILDKIFDFLTKTKSIVFNDLEKNEVKGLLDDLYVRKTKQRVEDFCNQINFDSTSNVVINNIQYPSLNTFVDNLLTVLEVEMKAFKDYNLTLMHGDLCFSNILTDTRSDTIKFIDPRGGLDDKFDSTLKTVGDFKYDIAKLGHSLIGNYDYIVTGFYNLSINDNHNYIFSLQHPSRESLKKYYYEKVEQLGVSKKFIHASIVNLFISMLPLHNEDKKRQTALLLNAYQLFYN